MSQEKKIKSSSVFTLIFFTFGSRVLGLLREVVRADFLGIGVLNDAFNAANLIPNLFRRLFAEASMTVAFVPTFKGYLKRDNKDETKEFLNSIFTTLTFLVSFTVILGMIFTPFLVKIFNKENTDITEVILLTRIIFPYLAVISLAALFQGLLNSLNIFGPGSFVPILFNIIVILSTYIFSNFTKNPARAMAIGTTLGGFGQMVFQLPYILKNGFFFKFVSLKKALTNPGTKNVGKLIAPTLISMGAYQLNIAVATSIAINTGVGISSALTYSLRLQELVLGVFAVSIGTILISTLSKDAKDLNWTNFSSSLRLSINAISLLTIPITIYAFIYANEIVELIYKKGQFNDADVLFTASIFKVHISGLYFIALSRILAPAFFSMEDSKTPAKLSVISIAAGIVLMYILSYYYKGNGIAAATILSSTILTILYGVFLTKKENINFRQILKDISPVFIRVTIYSLISILPVYFYKNSISSFINTGFRKLDIIIILVITALLFFALYILILLITKDKSVKDLKTLAKKRK